MNENQMTEIIYKYVVEGWSMQNIAEHFGGMNAGNISNALRPYHFGGKENKTGSSNFQGGFYKGRYRNGYVDRNGNRNSDIQITRDVLYGYVSENYYRDDKDSLEDYLFRQYGSADEAAEDYDWEEYGEENGDGFSFADMSRSFLNGIKGQSGGRSAKRSGGGSGSFGEGFSAWWNSLTRRQQVITIIVAVLVIMFVFFRDTFWSLVFAVVPTVGALAIVFFVIKWLMTGNFSINKGTGKKRSGGKSKKNSNIQFSPSFGGVIWFAIMAYIAIGGLKNGGSPIAALCIGAFGALGLIKTRK